eukprot:scaffold22956_cov32-Phaeocystis_antarctica.AAC.1
MCEQRCGSGGLPSAPAAIREFSRVPVPAHERRPSGARPQTAPGDSAYHGPARRAGSAEHTD